MPNDGFPAAFLDRDGVINEELGYVGRVKDFRFLPRVAEGMRLLSDLGFELVVITNQAGIAKGHYTEEDYQRLTTHMLDCLRRESVQVRAVYHCPHHPDGMVSEYSIVCDCRKPAPGMLIRAAADLSLNLDASILIGDKKSDLMAARAAGIGRTVLVASGHALPQDAAALADQVCENLYTAAVWVQDVIGRQSRESNNHG